MSARTPPLRAFVAAVNSDTFATASAPFEATFPKGECRGICLDVAGAVSVWITDTTFFAHPFLAAGIFHPIVCRGIRSTGSSGIVVTAGS